jgi:hypothetical protein
MSTPAHPREARVDAVGGAALGPGPEAAAQVHQVTVVDGRFTLASCTCGWVGAGRRQRAASRAEARDHALLYSDGRVLSSHHAPVRHRGAVDTTDPPSDAQSKPSTSAERVAPGA